MLVPKERICIIKHENGNVTPVKMYYAWDTKRNKFVDSSSGYATKEDCQKEIDFYNNFEVIQI